MANIENLECYNFYFSEENLYLNEAACSVKMKGRGRMRGIVLIWSLTNVATDFCVISSEFLFSNKGALILPS